MLQVRVRHSYDISTIDEHLRVNCARNLVEPEWGSRSGKITVCGNGPSLRQEVLPSGQPVAALNGALPVLLKRGVVPDYAICYDPTEQNATWYADAPDGVTYLVGSRAHPDVFSALKGKNVCIWHVYDQPELDAKIEGRLIGGGSTVGLKGINVLHGLGFDWFDCVGYDSCLSVTGAHHAGRQPWNDGEKVALVHVANRTFQATAWMIAQAQEALRQFGAAPYVVNVIGDGLLAHMVAEHEREKYREMWKRPEYRVWAPGEDTVERAINKLGMRPGDQVADFGCGTGRAAKTFQGLGFKVTGIDFAENCLDPGIDVSLLISDLWDLPPKFSAHWGYCTDVMEHIPTAKVADVLAAIARASRHGAYFMISTVPDGLGGLIGHKLHMTVRPPQWWKDQLTKLWPVVDAVALKDRVEFVCKRR